MIALTLAAALIPAGQPFADTITRVRRWTDYDPGGRVRAAVKECGR